MTDLAAMSPVSLQASSVEPSDLEQHRVELTAYCYRMLGSGLRGRGRRAGDAGAGLARRSTGSRGARRCAPGSTASPPTSASTCSRAEQRRARPMDLGPRQVRGRARCGPPCPRRPGSSRSPTAGCCRRAPTPPTWPWRVTPIRLAFVATLQHLPPRQRAVLILREVLQLAGRRGRRPARHHGGVGQQRAPAGPGDARGARPRTRREPGLDEQQRVLLDRYVDAFERYDIDALRRCCTRTRRSRCRPTRSGCGAARTS